MYKIIQAEIHYTYKFIVPISALITIGFLVYQRISADTGNLSLMLFPLTVATILQLIIHRSMEKRDRQLATVPLAIRQIALARILLYAAPCGLFYGIYFAYNLFSRIFNPFSGGDLYDKLMFSGMVLFGFSMYFILHDLAVSFSRKGLGLEGDLIAMIVLVVFALLIIPLMIAPLDGITAQTLQMICFVSGILSLYPAKVAFERRKSYLR